MHYAIYLNSLYKIQITMNTQVIIILTAMYWSNIITNNATPRTNWSNPNKDFFSF